VKETNFGYRGILIKILFKKKGKVILENIQRLVLIKLYHFNLQLKFLKIP